MIRVNGFAAAVGVLRRENSLDSLMGAAEAERAGGGPGGRPSEEVVREIIDKVRSGGDRQLLEYTRALDGVNVDVLQVEASEVKAAYESVEGEFVDAVKLAASRVRSFHEAFKPKTGVTYTEGGLGRQVRPLERVGLYVPGGAAAYPSTVVMTAVPARVAGVREILVASPPGRNGRLPAPTLIACDIVGIDRVFKVGGAQAIAALAFGTESIPRVDKICGPGNIFVTLAKKVVYGAVAIDGLAGPSEVVVVADEGADAASCAADLLAQAEHDPLASVVLITISGEVADQVERQVHAQLAQLSRRSVAAGVVERGIIAVVDNLDEGIELVNVYAPEHVSLAVGNAAGIVFKVRNAGCIFVGGHIPVALGDYVAGPSHVLPTGGSARFSSALGVEDFLKTSSVVALDGSVCGELKRPAIALALAEGLDAHARALEMCSSK